jgi:hypothetical protein
MTRQERHKFAVWITRCHSNDYFGEMAMNCECAKTILERDVDFTCVSKSR